MLSPDDLLYSRTLPDHVVLVVTSVEKSFVVGLYEDQAGLEYELLSGREA